MRFGFGLRDLARPVASRCGRRRGALHHWTPPDFLPVSAEVHSQIQQFMVYEALLLDHGCIERWLCLFSKTIDYGWLDCTGREYSPRKRAIAADRDALRRHAKSLGLASQNEPSMGRRITCRSVTNVSISFAHCVTSIMYEPMCGRLRSQIAI